MCHQFEQETTTICLEHVKSMLAEFASDPMNKWVAKDAAVHLILGISVQKESTMQGVSAVNPGVDILNFFSSNILTELQETNQSIRPMVKATAIKFTSTFRNQFAKEHLTALMPLLVTHLSSPSVVVHTYAAAAIEKILTTKEVSADNKQRPKFGGEELKPFLESLFKSLFDIVENAQLNENEYVMKCIMRSLSTAKDDVLPVTQIVLDKLTAVLGRIARNPRNPQFNHYLFESISVMIRAVCTKDAAYTESFEGLLFGPFEVVLQMEVLELTPYVFQVLAQILEYRTKESGLGQSYAALFRPLLTPLLWDRKGNIPPLTRLLRAYLVKGPNDLVAQGHIVGILGVFQKLISSRANEKSGFELLSSIIVNLPPDAIEAQVGTLFQLLLVRLQQSKSGSRYYRLVTDFFALYMAKLGPQVFFDRVNAIQPGLGMMILGQIWIPRFESDLPVRMEAKCQVLALTKLLCENSEFLTSADGPKAWAQVLVANLKILSSPNVSIGLSPASGDVHDPAEVEIGYDATFSRLHFAASPAIDPFPNVNDVVSFFVQSLHSLFASHPGKFPPLIQDGLRADPKLGAYFESLLRNAGLSVV